MYLFIAIILIAELIIATNLVCLIIKADKKVLALSDKLTDVRPKIKDGLKSPKDAVAKLVEGVHKLSCYAEKKKQQYTMSIIKTVLIYALLIMLKGKSKKCLSAMQLAVVLKDCWDRGAACNL